MNVESLTLIPYFHQKKSIKQNTFKKKVGCNFLKIAPNLPDYILKTVLERLLSS